MDLWSNIEIKCPLCLLKMKAFLWMTNAYNLDWLCQFCFISVLRLKRNHLSPLFTHLCTPRTPFILPSFYLSAKSTQYETNWGRAILVILLTGIKYWSTSLKTFHFFKSSKNNLLSSFSIAFTSLVIFQNIYLNENLFH